MTTTTLSLPHHSIGHGLSPLHLRRAAAAALVAVVLLLLALTTRPSGPGPREDAPTAGPPASVQVLAGQP